MVIQIVGVPSKVFEEEHTIMTLMRLFKNKPESLEFFIEIYNQFPTKKNFSEEKLQDLVDGLKKDYPKVNEESIEVITKASKEIYSLDENSVSDLRGDLVELIVTELGPINNELRASYISIKDGQFFKDGVRIGEDAGHPDSNVDSLFHSKDTYENIEDVCCESYECKASLSNFFYVAQGRRPPRLIDDKRFNKLTYLEYLVGFFSSSNAFTMSFATFQSNIRLDRRKIRRMGFNNLQAIGSREITENWIKKYS